jgi:hypothetical protein
VVVHAAALDARLEQARLRLVTERGAARRRLGSDLHDRIGHQLTGVTLTNVDKHAGASRCVVRIHIAADSTWPGRRQFELVICDDVLLGYFSALRSRVRTRLGWVQQLVPAAQYVMAET